MQVDPKDIRTCPALFMVRGRQITIILRHHQLSAVRTANAGLRTYTVGEETGKQAPKHTGVNVEWRLPVEGSWVARSDITSNPTSRTQIKYTLSHEIMSAQVIHCSTIYIFLSFAEIIILTP